MKNLISILFLLAYAVGSFAQTADTMTIKVYVHNQKTNPNMEDCSKVEAVSRTIPKTKAVARAALDELFKGVTDDEADLGFVSFKPEDTKGILKSVKVKNKSAYVNFDKSLTEQMSSATSSCGGASFLSRIEQTLVQFPTIEKVFYAIEGKPADFYDWIQIGECPKELKNCSGKDF